LADSARVLLRALLCDDETKNRAHAKVRLQSVCDIQTEAKVRINEVERLNQLIDLYCFSDSSSTANFGFRNFFRVLERRIERSADTRHYRANRVHVANYKRTHDTTDRRHLPPQRCSKSTSLTWVVKHQDRKDNRGDMFHIASNRNYYIYIYIYIMNL
jgi:hypothetical protein